MSSLFDIAFRAVAAVKAPRRLTITRTAAATMWVDGKPSNATIGSFQIDAMVMPIGDDEQFEPKGSYSDLGRAIYTKTDLKIASPQEPDSVVIDGITFYILHVEPWDEGGCKALAYAVV